MRQIHTHQVNPVNDALSIHVMDEAGHGGACHVYRIGFPDGSTQDISFQNGPIKEVGVNGLTHELLLAILIDRLECFQKGPYACDQNGAALEHLRDAVEWLHARTLERIDRGVEGTHTI